MFVKDIDYRLCSPRTPGGYINLAVALGAAAVFGGGLVLAHELGHRLMGAAHWPNCNENNLMCEFAHSLGNNLVEEQCANAHETAMTIQQGFSWENL